MKLLIAAALFAIACVVVLADPAPAPVPDPAPVADPSGYGNRNEHRRNDNSYGRRGSRSDSRSHERRRGHRSREVEVIKVEKEHHRGGDRHHRSREVEVIKVEVDSREHHRGDHDGDNKHHDKFPVIPERTSKRVFIFVYSQVHMVAVNLI
jgi:hypothetical protein